MSVEEWLTSQPWGLLFAYFPNFADSKPYRVYRIADSDQQVLLGAGVTQKEALAAAMLASQA